MEQEVSADYQFDVELDTEQQYVDQFTTQCVRRGYDVIEDSARTEHHVVDDQPYLRVFLTVKPVEVVE